MQIFGRKMFERSDHGKARRGVRLARVGWCGQSSEGTREGSLLGHGDAAAVDLRWEATSKVEMVRGEVVQSGGPWPLPLTCFESLSSQWSVSGTWRKGPNLRMWSPKTSLWLGGGGCIYYRDSYDIGLLGTEGGQPYKNLALLGAATGTLFEECPFLFLSMSSGPLANGRRRAAGCHHPHP